MTLVDPTEERAVAAVVEEPAAVEPAAAERLVTTRFLVVTMATLAYFVAVGIGLPTMPRYVKDGLGGSDLAVGLTVTAYGIAAVACRPLLSWASQRFGQRKVMLFGSGLGAFGYAIHPLATHLPTLIALRGVMGIAEAFHFVGAATIISELAPAKRRAEATSYFSVAVFCGLGLGPVIGEHFAGSGDFTAAFHAAALFALLAFGITAVFQRPVPAVDRPVRRSGQRVPLIHPKGLVTGSVLALAMIGYAAWSTFLPLRADEIGMSAGTLFLAYSLFVLVLRVLGARVPERVGLGRCAAAAFVCISAGLAMMALVAGPAGLWIGTLTMGSGIALLYPSLMAITVNSVNDPLERAAVVATFTMFFEVGSALGGVILGGVAALRGYQGAFAAGAAISLAGLGLFWVLVLSPRRRLAVAAASA